MWQTAEKYRKKPENKYHHHIYGNYKETVISFMPILAQLKKNYGQRNKKLHGYHK